MVIFSERIETLRWLQDALSQAACLRAAQLEILHGGMTDTEQQELVDRFGRKDDPMRVLLCSDVASEGLNLHYFCHRLVHFDLPWSLMVFQQRNGRVDRYGQDKQPLIVYRQRTSPAWMRAYRLSNSRATLKCSMKSKRHAKKDGCSTCYYRTALGRMAKSSQHSDNLFIY